MATKTWPFSNSTESTHTVTPIELGLCTNYAVDNDTDNNCTLRNKRCTGFGSGETIQIFGSDVAKLDVKVPVQNPDLAAGYHRFATRVDTVLRSTDANGNVTDIPIVAQLIVSHQKSDLIDANDLAVVATRAISAARRADGTWRFDDYGLGAYKPYVD